MTLKNKLIDFLSQRYFRLIEQLESLYRKVEVITDSNAIVNSIRIMIVMLAFLMGYIHTPGERSEISKNNKTEKIVQQNTVDFIDIGK